MKRKSENYDVARALSGALEPLIDVCIDLGITSPELESLLRAAFVNRAFDKLPKHSHTGRAPSTTKVSLAAGVHRVEVGKIRAGGSAGARETMQAKGQLYSKSARVLAGWTTDPRFLTSGGLPLDLPMERNKQKRSFEDLVDKYAPSNHPGTVLKEMSRRGNVEILADDIIRFKAVNAKPKGVTPTNVAQAALRMNRLGQTLFNNILNPDEARLYEETGKIGLSAKQLAMIRPILERRAKTFLRAIEEEFGIQGVKDGEATLNVGVGLFSWDWNSS